MYNLDYDILLAEYINSGDIDNSILNTRIKMQYRDLMLKMNKELHINSLKPSWEPIRKVFNKYKNHYIDLLNYVLEKRRDCLIQEKQKNYPITRYYFDTNLIDCNIDSKTCTRR